MSAFVSVALVGEAVQGEEIARVYRSGSLGGDVAARMTPFGAAASPLLRRLELGISAGYQRISGNPVNAAGIPSTETTWLWYAPVSLVAGPRWTLARADLGVAVGPSWVVWAEKPGPHGAGYSGVKPSLYAQVDVRVDPLAFVAGTGPPPSNIRIEASVGGRLQWPGASCGWDCGLDFGAPRVSLGVGAVLR